MRWSIGPQHLDTTPGVSIGVKVENGMVVEVRGSRIRRAIFNFPISFGEYDCYAEFGSDGKGAGQLLVGGYIVPGGTMAHQTLGSFIRIFQGTVTVPNNVASVIVDPFPSDLKLRGIFLYRINFGVQEGDEGSSIGKSAKRPSDASRKRKAAARMKRK